MIKRAFDVMVSLLGLLLLSPLMISAAMLVCHSSPGPVLFVQERMGRGFRPFRIYKFRSMDSDAPDGGASITSGDDPRITRVGRFLRKTKIDELPQLFNVLRGDMSLVGPRPEVPRYVEMFRADYEELLRVRPGITDFASLKYRNEGAVLERSPNPERDYVERVLPDKIRLSKEYVAAASFRVDLLILIKTLACWRAVEPSGAGDFPALTNV